MSNDTSIRVRPYYNKNNYDKLNWMKRGFTLIELLIVIAIIGVLSSIVISSLNSARNKALDSKRFSEAKTLEQAIKMYEIEHNSVPPSVGEPGGNTFSNSCTGTLQTSLQPLIDEGLLNNIPIDSGECIAYNTNLSLWAPGQCGGGDITVQYLFIIHTPEINMNLPVWYSSHYYCIMGPEI
jgi:prepilin-type N-terminal cleavage/methylation domain-containing protein